MNTAKHIRNLFALSIAAIAFTACGKEERIAPAAAPGQYTTTQEDRPVYFEQEQIQAPTNFAKPWPVSIAEAPTVQVEKVKAPQTIGTQLHVQVQDVKDNMYTAVQDMDRANHSSRPAVTMEPAPHVGNDTD